MTGEHEVLIGYQASSWAQEQSEPGYKSSGNPTPSSHVQSLSRCAKYSDRPLCRHSRVIRVSPSLRGITQIRMLLRFRRIL